MNVRLLDSIRATNTLDVDGAVFFARELTKIEARVYRVQYPELKARLLIPVSNEGGPGVQHIGYRIFDRVGMAKVINSYKSDDIPMTDISAREKLAKVYTIATAFGYSVEDIDAAQMAGMPLESEKAEASRKSVEEKINKIAFNGDDEYELMGLLNNPNIPTGNVVNGAKGSPQWATKTPGEILFDILDLFGDIVDSTNEVEVPDTLLLPISQKTLLLQPRSDTSDKTVLQWLVENIPWLKSVDDVIGVPQLKGAGAGGKDVMVAYRRDPEKLTLRIPLEVEIRAPQLRDLYFRSIVRARTGGVVVRFPMSLRFAEGI